LSFWWLALLEVLAFGTTAALLFLHLIALGQALWLLPVLVAAAGLVFIGLSLLKTRNATPTAVASEASLGAQPWEQHLKLGRKLLSEERYEDAAGMFEEVLKKDPNNWQAYNYLGLSSSRRGLYEEARSAYERAVSLQPEYASAHFNLVTALEKLDLPDAALARWREYLEVGQAANERVDLINHARSRIAALEKTANRGDPDEVSH
jgi:Flp pilus assembly protein TadD